MGLREIESRLPPGFRFYPSDEELVCFYLRKKVASERVASGTLIEVDLHAREPWQLPEVAKLTADEWYFFSFRDRKYATGSRTNRATKTGYWKATGKDRIVHETAARAAVGMRKTLVFYRGRAPNGHKTGWVMHEFRLETPSSPPKEDWVLCRVFNKQQRKASEAEQGSNSNHADFAGGAGTAGPSSPTSLLGSSPDPTVVDKFDHHQTAAAVAMGGGSSTPVLLMHGHGDHMISGHCSSSSSSSALLNLAMLQHSFLEYCPGPAMHDDMALGASNTGCYAGSSISNDAMMELGQHVGFEEHGMGEIMEMEPQGGGSCYRDGLYF